MMTPTQPTHSLKSAQTQRNCMHHHCSFAFCQFSSNYHKLSHNNSALFFISSHQLQTSQMIIYFHPISPNKKTSSHFLSYVILFFNSAIYWVLQQLQMQEVHTLKVVDGHYSIKDRKLGEGSFAKTYLAVDSKNGKQLACKMIEKKNLIDKINLSKNKSLTKEYFINALKNQVKTWKAIHHNHIVEFIDFSETANNIYFFLQFCSGGNLETYLTMHGHIQEKKALPLFLQLARGCYYLQSKNIYHRDIKTQNILINAEGILKLSDFGFAKMVGDEQTKYNPAAQTSVGTPIYMSPQIIMGDPYTIKCDVWSLGVVFYKMLYNLYPWQKTDNIMVLVQRMKKPFDFPPNIEVSEWIKQLLKGMLTIDEGKRWSIKQVLDALQKQSKEMEIE